MHHKQFVLKYIQEDIAVQTDTIVIGVHRKGIEAKNNLRIVCN